MDVTKKTPGMLIDELITVKIKFYLASVNFEKLSEGGLLKHFSAPILLLSCLKFLLNLLASHLILLIQFELFVE